tara:strand:- start:1604 stop:2113 length:510 start_codon:yes stop_codon:yes gene_type:complete
MNDLRKRTREILIKIIENEKYSRNLEIGIFNYTIKQGRIKKIVRKWSNADFRNIYINRFRTIYNNINPTSNIGNTKLLERIKNNEVLAKELAFMSHHEMYPEKWKILIDKKIKKDSLKGSVDLSSATDEFKCGKCKQNKCTYYQLQTRSADEPMTTYVTCLNCGNNWKC